MFISSTFKPFTSASQYKPLKMAFELENFDMGKVNSTHRITVLGPRDSGKTCFLAELAYLNRAHLSGYLDDQCSTSDLELAASTLQPGNIFFVFGKINRALIQLQFDSKQNNMQCFETQTIKAVPKDWVKGNNVILVLCGVRDDSTLDSVYALMGLSATYKKYEFKSIMNNMLKTGSALVITISNGIVKLQHYRISNHKLAWYKAKCAFSVAAGQLAQQELELSKHEHYVVTAAHPMMALEPWYPTAALLSKEELLARTRHPNATTYPVYYSGLQACVCTLDESEVYIFTNTAYLKGCLSDLSDISPTNIRIEVQTSYNCAIVVECIRDTKQEESENEAAITAAAEEASKKRKTEGLAFLASAAERATSTIQPVGFNPTRSFMGADLEVALREASPLFAGHLNIIGAGFPLMDNVKAIITRLFKNNGCDLPEHAFFVAINQHFKQLFDSLADGIQQLQVVYFAKKIPENAYRAIIGVVLLLSVTLLMSTIMTSIKHSFIIAENDLQKYEQVKHLALLLGTQFFESKNGQSFMQMDFKEIESIEHMITETGYEAIIATF